MPVSFLTEDQRNRYGQYAGEPSAEQLARFFHLDNTDRGLMAACRGDHNRLGFALQLCTIRFLGTFLEDLRTVPSVVVNYVAHQLAIDDPSSHAQYCAGEQRWEHAAQIRTRCGYQDFLTWPVQFRLNRWLYALCWMGTSRLSVLFDRTTWLVSHKVLLPGVSVLERLVARLRSRVQERLWRSLIAGLSLHSRDRLEELLATPPGERKSQLERLRTGPVLRNAPELVRALRRLANVRELTLDVSVTVHLPRIRVLDLARFAATAKVTTIERMPVERHTAMLVAFISTLEATAQDDALEVLEIVLADIFSEAATAAKKATLRTLKDLDAAALQTANVTRIVLDSQIGDGDIRQAVFRMMSRIDLEASVQQIENIVRPPEDVYYKELQGSYRRVRRFLPALLRTITFGASPAGQPLLEALEYMRTMGLDAGRKKSIPDPPLNIVNSAWRKDVMGSGKVDLKAYTFCLLDRVRTALRRRDLFVSPSVRYADPRIGLLEGKAWESARPFICRSLDLATSADEVLAALRLELDATYRAVAANFPNNRAVRIEQVNGKDQLILTALDKLDEPPSLVELRERVAARGFAGDPAGNCGPHGIRKRIHAHQRARFAGVRSLNQPLRSSDR